MDLKKRYAVPSLYRVVIISLILLTGSSQGVRSQEMLGAVLGNRAGINAVQFNPSAMHGSRLWLDIQVAGADISLINNYLYLSRTEFIFWDILKSGYVLPSHEEDYGTEVRNFYHRDNSNPKNIFLNLRINGPSAMMVWKDHAFGIHSALRVVSSVIQLPPDVSNFMYLGLNYKPQQNINFIKNKPFGMAQLSWFEVGLSYAYKVYGRGFNRLDAGLSVRKLFGLTGVFAVVDNLDYVVLDDSTLQINNISARYGFSIPVDYGSTGFSISADPLLAGGGWGFDLGMTYTRLKQMHQKQYIDRPCEQRFEDYQYRIGLSLIDIGWIRFKERAQVFGIDNRSSLWEDLTRISFGSIDQIMDTISYKFYGDTASAYTGDRFSVWLPSAFTAQFDYHYKKNWFLNTTLVLPFEFSSISVIRPALLAITPRYETRWFEANIPFSLYDWYQPRIGLSLRFYVLTVGTEKLGSFLGLSNFNGVDFYFTLKIPFEKGLCGRKLSKSCPAYQEFRHKKL